MHERDETARAGATKNRVVILGGGFGAVATARRLERLVRGRPDVEIVLISRDNFLFVTPLLFEVFSGALEPRSCSIPIREALRSARFIEADVESVDLARRTVRWAGPGSNGEFVYDQLVLALGSTPNRKMIPGSEHAFTFKTLADALLLRNYVIEQFERADVETDARRQAELLAFVIIGGGLVGAELVGELTEFVDGIVPRYPNVNRDDVRFLLLEAASRIMPEVDPTLATYAARELTGRRGVELRLNARVSAIEPHGVRLGDETILAGTVVLTAGTIPNPVIASLPVLKDRVGRIVVEPTMHCQGRPGVWALGDCAAVPGPDGKSYPSLAQHALREGRVLAENIVAALDGGPPRPFVYRTLGVMGSLGHGKGFAQFLKIRLRGFPAWFIRHTYYLLQMPGWNRRLRLVTDWIFALLFRPDVTKLTPDGATASRLRDLAAAEAAASVEYGASRPTPTAEVLQ